MKYCIGIDLGGTNIKGGLVDENINVVYDTQIKTEVDKGTGRVIENISKLVNIILTETKVDEKDILGVGIGIPGMINAVDGVVTFAGNFNWVKFNIVSELKKKIHFPIKVINDANAAGLGEHYYGCGKNYHSSILVTLGTGVGGGIIINDTLLEGNKGAGAEIGHMVLISNGEQCTCGNKGCFEAYSSATALIRETRRAIEKNTKSAMYYKYINNEIDGATAFDFYDTDDTAKEVIDTYISYLADGLVNLANIFRPEIIMLGGGICQQGDKLLKPLQKIFDSRVFAGSLGPYVSIVKASLGNKAGFLGATTLFFNTIK